MRTNAAFRPARTGFTLVEMLVVIAIIGTLVGITLPAVHAARESSRKTGCANNLKQLALAIHNFHDSHRHVPISGPESASGDPPAHGWVIYVTPFLEQQQLYDRYDFSANWNAPANQAIAARQLGVLLCPTSSDPDRLDTGPQAGSNGTAAITDYAAITHVDPRLVDLGLAEAAGLGVMPKNADPHAKSHFDQIADGLSNTLLLTESSGRPQVFRGRTRYEEPPSVRVNGGAWARPASDFALIGSSTDGVTVPGPCPMNCTNGLPFTSQYPDSQYQTDGSGQIYSFHPHGVNSAFADGSVHFLTAEVDMRIMANLVTRSGHELAPRIE